MSFLWLLFLVSDTFCRSGTLGFGVLASRVVLELASELLDGIFCRPCLPTPGPNGVLRMPKPSMNMPEVVRCLAPALGTPLGLGLSPGLYVGLRAGTTMRRPRLASGSGDESSERSRGCEKDDAWRSRGEVITEPNVGGAGLADRVGGLRKLGVHADQLGDAIDLAEGAAAAGERPSSAEDNESS